MYGQDIFVEFLSSSQNILHIERCDFISLELQIHNISIVHEMRKDMSL